MRSEETDTAAGDRFARARRYGFSAREVPQAQFVAKAASHDDGPGHGLFLGPIGGPAFSRDLSGRFSRWHLQPGMHLVSDVAGAFLAVRWVTAGEPRFARLCREDAQEHEVAVLHPFSHELFTFEDAPFRVLLTAFSPVIPRREQEAALPVVVFDVEVQPLVDTDTLPEVDVALFWPNLNGWRASAVTSTARGDLAWPGQHHAGNRNHKVSPAFEGACVLQSTSQAVAGPEDLNGDVAVSVGGDADSFTQQTQFRLSPMETGVPSYQQVYTLDAVVDSFRGTGRLGAQPDGSWDAHWHEPVGSAVAAHFGSGRQQARTRFALALDWPVVRFGQGRCWTRKSAAHRSDEEQGVSQGRHAVAMTEQAHREADRWLTELDQWHVATLDRLTDAGWSPEVAGCVVNELNLVTSLGTAWVEGTPEGHSPTSPTCPGAEHLGLLEGFDVGYFYYNTTDLWHYAFPAVTVNWPRLGDIVFADLAAAVEAEDPTERPIYRPAEQRPMLVSRKLPHDVGGPAEDPFVRVNGYSMRDDPNTWRDSNPAFVLATLAHHRLAGRELDDSTWQVLRDAASITADQAGENAGVPRHEEFGDSTWDNLGLRGYSTYTAALCAGMWAVLAAQCRARGEDPAPYEVRLRSAQEVLDTLWNGRFYRASTEGKYAQAVMPDSIMGIFYADVCGIRDVVPVERLAGHLATSYSFAYENFQNGELGPLLVAEEQLRHYERDGGEELQVNEVIVGSAWLFVAMLKRYGLHEQAGNVGDSLARLLHGGSGLQFRTPAAVDAEGRFRAPLNLRPLSVWWLAATTGEVAGSRWPRPSRSDAKRGAKGSAPCVRNAPDSAACAPSRATASSFAPGAMTTPTSSWSSSRVGTTCLRWVRIRRP